MLKVRVKDITPEGIHFHDKVAVDQLELGGDDDPKFSGPIDVAVKVDKVGNVLFAKTKFECFYASECALCLEPVNEKFLNELTMDFPYDKSVEYIDVGEEIRQELVLNNPTRILCKKDCKGICPGCGASLNTEKCKCR